jgi:hypothetical protein
MLTRSTPRRLGTKHIIPTHAMLFGMRDAIVTPVSVDVIPTIPVTQARSVVCSGLNPKDSTISWCWEETEDEMLVNAANNAKSQVFGSFKASVNCSFLKCLFSTPVWFSFVIHTQPKRITRVLITYFDTSNDLCPFILGQEPSICRGVWEQETAHS